jgi:peptidoglycan/xylan/chitin deacetylase (PgdA/CDA1 family)
MLVPGRALLDTVLRWTPAQAVMQLRRRGLLAVVTYHAVDDASTFESHLDVLEDIGRFVSLADVVANAIDGTPLPSRPILMTFDDGDPSLLETAAPCLHARGIPAAAFLVTDLIGSDHMLWTTEVEQLVAAGGRTSLEPATDGRALVRTLKARPDHVRRQVIDELRATATGDRPKARQLRATDVAKLVHLGLDVSSHTMSHPCLPQCSDEAIDREVAGSRDALRELLGLPPVALAYPNGFFDSRSRRAAEGAGYAVAFGFDHRLSRVPPGDPYTISRLRINGQASENRLRTVVSGLHPALHHFVGRV